MISQDLSYLRVIAREFRQGKYTVSLLRYATVLNISALQNVKKKIK